MKKLLLALLILLPLQACATSAPTLEVFSLVPLQVGAQQIDVQLADTPEKRAQGLMYQIGADPGMLLLYAKPTEIALWMANTAMALDVAFISADWTIVQLVQLQPLDETPVPSPGAIIAALEMPRGWFASHGVNVGDKVVLSPGS
jgi:uncharacterized protein